MRTASAVHARACVRMLAAKAAAHAQAQGVYRAYTTSIRRNQLQRTGSDRTHSQRESVHRRVARSTDCTSQSAPSYTKQKRAVQTRVIGARLPANKASIPTRRSPPTPLPCCHLAQKPQRCLSPTCHLLPLFIISLTFVSVVHIVRYMQHLLHYTKLL